MATFGDLKTYVENDGWTEEKNRARGRVKTGDHWRYRKDVPGEGTLRTKVSHSLNDDRIGPDLFARILRDQLKVDRDRFWDVVRGRNTPQTPSAATAATVPGWLVQRPS